MSKDPLIEQLERALTLEKEGKSVDAVRIARWIIDKEKTHPAALEAALIWARADGTNPQALFALSSSFLFQGKFAESAQGFDLVTKMDPKNAQAYASHGLCLRSLGDLQRSLDVTHQALALDPDDIIAHMNYTDVLFDMGEVQKALDHIMVTQKKHPNNPGVNTNIARMHMSAGEWEKSLPFHKKAMQEDPTNPAYHSNYMIYLHNIDDQDTLVRELQKTIDLFEKRPQYKKMLLQDYYRAVYLHALTVNKLVEPGDKILVMRDMDKIGTESASLEMVDQSNDVWLFKANNLRCFSSDWAFYDDKELFMNLRVTGRWYVFLLAHGVKNRSYVRDNFPVIEMNEPGIILGGVNNYYHWLIDYMPRLDILRTHPELKDLPLYVNDDFTSFQRESLEYLGLADRVKTVPRDHVLLMNNIYIPYVPGRPTKPNGEPDWMKPNENPFIVQWLRKNFLKDIDLTQPRKRYFISRANASFRRCLNEDVIFAIAQQYGFEKMQNEGKTFMEQVTMYATAEAVIGPHGAGFANMIFAPENATAFELIPKNRKLPFFEAISKQLGQRYLSMEGPILRTFQDKPPDFGDFMVDADEFARIMQENFG